MQLDNMKKVCDKCGVGKNIKMFRVDRRIKCGYGNSCKTCCADGYREWYEKNKTKQLAYQRKYYLLHKEKMINKSRDHQLLHKEQRAKYLQGYYIRNKNIIKAHQNRWQKNTEKGRICGRIAVQKRRRNLFDLDMKIVRTVYKDNISKFGRLTCELCFKPIKHGEDSLEHFHPVSRRDEYTKSINARENLGVAHGAYSLERCNSRKNKMTRNEWFMKFMGVEG